MRFLPYLIGILFFVGCTPLDRDDSDDTTTTDITAAVSAVGEVVTGTSSSSDSDEDNRTACSAVGFSNCTAGVIYRNFSTDGGDTGGCSRGAINVYGQAVLTFSVTNCTFSTAGESITRTLSNHYYTFSGRKILTYTGVGSVGGKTIGNDDLKDYSGTSRSGGSVMTRGAALIDTLAINGIHRRAVRSTGLYGFWHTLYTNSPLNVTRGTGTWTIASGDLVIAHNRVATTVTQTFNNVEFTASCCYPTAGSITYTPGDATLAGFATFTTTFSSTCGSVTIGGTSVTLPTCGS